METLFYLLALLVMATPAFVGALRVLRRSGHAPAWPRLVGLVLAVTAVLVAGLSHLTNLAEFYVVSALGPDTCAANRALCTWVDTTVAYSGWLVVLLTAVVAFGVLRLIANSWPKALSSHAAS